MFAIASYLVGFRAISESRTAKPRRLQGAKLEMVNGGGSKMEQKLYQDRIAGEKQLCKPIKKTRKK